MLHIFPSFAAGGIQLRLATITGGLPAHWRHSILALDGDYSAMDAASWPDTVSALRDASVHTQSALTRIIGARNVIKRLNPDLVITNNWGTIEWAAATTLLPSARLIHTENGFGADEAFQLNKRRGWLRRFVLRQADGVIVCSKTLENIALHHWRLPPSKLHFIPDGIDVARFQNRSASGGGNENSSAQLSTITVGCVAPLRPEKNLTALLDAFHLAHERCPDLRLKIAGDGPERRHLEKQAAQLPSHEAIEFCGFVTEIEAFYANIDIAALSSDTEQRPNSVLQAMGAGLPIAAFDVGDIREMVSPANGPMIVQRRDIIALSEAFVRLVSDPNKRRVLGAANAQLCASRDAADTMAERYRTLIESALAL